MASGTIWGRRVAGEDAVLEGAQADSFGADSVAALRLPQRIGYLERPDRCGMSFFTVRQSEEYRVRILRCFVFEGSREDCGSVLDEPAQYFRPSLIRSRIVTPSPNVRPFRSSRIRIAASSRSFLERFAGLPFPPASRALWRMSETYASGSARAARPARAPSVRGGAQLDTHRSASSLAAEARLAS